MFEYKADLVLSKSWLNRALIIQAYQPKIQFAADSAAEDVLVLKKSLSDLENNENEFYLGQGGTSFRFFCFFVSRRPGRWSINAHPRLLERPQYGLSELLDQLKVQVEFEKEKVVIRSEGWKIPDLLHCRANESSQFISALLLNAWNLTSDLNIKIQGPIVSENYLKMTMTMLKKFGMQIEEQEILCISKRQSPKVETAQPELDVSSAFSLTAAAVINGNMEITNWNSQSLQPDLVFLKFFDQMQIKYFQSGSSFIIQRQSHWNSLNADLMQSPDLFPVLSILCALANGKSELYGAEQLKHKESNRLAKTKQLLDLTGFKTELKEDGLVIYGQSSMQDKKNLIRFDPDLDHRMAMAAGLLKLAGYNIQIQNPEAVNKSYPSFWNDIRVNP